MYRRRIEPMVSSDGACPILGFEPLIVDSTNPAPVNAPICDASSDCVRKALPLGGYICVKSYEAMQQLNPTDFSDVSSKISHSANPSIRIPKVFAYSTPPVFPYEEPVLYDEIHMSTYEKPLIASYYTDLMADPPPSAYNAPIVSRYNPYSVFPYSPPYPPEQFGKNLRATCCSNHAKPHQYYKWFV